MKLKNVQTLYTAHLVASIVLFFIVLVYAKSLRVVLAIIEVTGFDPIAYDEPTYKFAQRAVFFCALTIFAGYKTRARLPLTGALLVGNGVCFFCFALVMFSTPRYLNIHDAFWYWCFYICANIVLTIFSIINYEKAVPIIPIYEDTILDDLGE